MNHVSKTVLIYLDTRQKKSSRKLPNEYTIKRTVILTMTVYDGYHLQTLKTIIPIKNTHAHTHLINTCSNKFGATLGLKIVHQSKKPALREEKNNYYYVHIVIIIIIHNKHYIIQPLQYDCTQLGKRRQGRLLFLSISDCHISVTSDLALSGKKKTQITVLVFLRNRDMKEISLGVKMSQEYDHSMICQTVKTLLQAQDTQDYKRLVFFSS